MTPPLPERIERILDRIIAAPHLAHPSVAEITRLCTVIRLRPCLLDPAHVSALAASVAAVLARDRVEHEHITRIVLTLDLPEPLAEDAPPSAGATVPVEPQQASHRGPPVALVGALIAAGLLAALIVDPLDLSQADEPPAPPPAAADESPVRPAAPAEATSDIRDDPAIISRRAFPVSLPEVVTRVDAPTPAPGPAYDLGRALLGLGLFVVWLGLIGRRQWFERRRRAETERSTLEPDREQPALRSTYSLVERRTLLAVADLLGRIHRPARGEALDGEATAEATADEAGRFAPRYERASSPSHVTVLVDLERGDHVWAGRTLTLLHRLRRQGVGLDVFAYRSPIHVSGPQLEPIDADGNPRTDSVSWSALLRTVRPLSPEARPALLLIARRPPPRLHDGRLPSWLHDLTTWRRRAWLDPDPRPIEARPPDEMHRLPSDFEALARIARRLPLDDRGLPAAAAWLASGGQRVVAAPIPRWRPPDEAHMARWLALALLVPDARWDEIERLRLAIGPVGHIFTRPCDVQHLLDHVEALARGEVEPAYTAGEARIDRGSGYGALHGLDLPPKARTRLIIALAKRPGGVALIRQAAAVLLDDIEARLAALKKGGEGTQREKVLEAKRARHHLLIEVDLTYLEALRELELDAAAREDVREIVDLLQRWKAAKLELVFAGRSRWARRRARKLFERVVEPSPEVRWSWKTVAWAAALAAGMVAVIDVVALAATAPEITLVRPVDRSAVPGGEAPPEARAVPDGMMALPAGRLRRGGGVVSNGDFMMTMEPVTVRQWDAIMARQVGVEGATDVSGSRPESIQVNWYEAARYLNARSRSEGFQPCYDLQECSYSRFPLPPDANASSMKVYRCTWARPLDDCDGYRLPTKEEVYYAGFVVTSYPWLTLQDLERASSLGIRSWIHLRMDSTLNHTGAAEADKLLWSKLEPIPLPRLGGEPSYLTQAARDAEAWAAVFSINEYIEVVRPSPPGEKWFYAVRSIPGDPPWYEARLNDSGGQRSPADSSGLVLDSGHPVDPVLH